MQKISNTELLGAYVSALGTPYPVGEFVQCDDEFEMIIRYEFDLNMGGLVAVTDHGSKVSDFYQMADGARKADINRFFGYACGQF